MDVLKIFITVSLAALAAGGAQAQSWQPIGPDGGLVQKLVPAGDGSSRVYALADNGLHISDDVGRSWRSSQSAAAPVLTALVVSPLQPMRLFAAEVGGRLLRSENRGESWSPTGYSNGINGALVLVMIGDTLLLSDYTGVKRSTDGGATFGPVQGWPAGQPLNVLAERPGHTGQAIGGIYLGPMVDGASMLYRTVDGGANWTPLLAEADASEVDAIDYSSPLAIAVLADGQLFRSADNGATWSAPQVLMNGGSMTRMNSELLVAVGSSACQVLNNQFVVVSDCGTGLVNTSGSNISLAAVRDGGWIRVLATAPAIGVQAMDSFTNTWSASNRQLQGDMTRGLALSAHSALLLSGQLRPDNRGAPLLRSDDGGLSWTRGLGDPPWNGAATLIRSIEIDPTSGSDGPAIVYAAGRGRMMPNNFTSGGIYKSDDGGINWLPLNNGLLPFAGGSYSGVWISTVRKVALDPRSCEVPPAAGACTQGPLRRVFALAEGGSSAVASQHYRVVRSEEGGNNWSAVAQSLPADILGEGWYEAARPIDLEFDRSGTAIYLSMYADAYNDDDTPRIPTVASGVFKSVDGGTTWMASSNGLPLVTGSATTTRNVFAMAAHPRRNGVLWASTVEPGQGSQLHRSDDAGANWTTLAQLPNCDVRDLQIAPEAPQVLLAAGFAVAADNGCLLRSEDGGASWTALHANLPGPGIYDVRRDPRDLRRLVVAGQRGVWALPAPADHIFNDLEL